MELSECSETALISRSVPDVPFFLPFCLPASPPRVYHCLPLGNVRTWRAASNRLRVGFHRESWARPYTKVSGAVPQSAGAGVRAGEATAASGFQLGTGGVTDIEDVDDILAEV